MLMRFAETAEPRNPGDYDHGQIASEIMVLALSAATVIVTRTR
jgi:hypothetical protein